jgi:hypothetical protein
MSNTRTLGFARAIPCSILALLFAGCADSPTAAASEEVRIAHTAAAARQPVLLDFEKCAVGPGAWEGDVAGAFTGDLRTELTDLRVTGSIWHVRFDWIITAGAHSFTADLSGILNTGTGRVVMNGTVVDGHLLGARVHEEGQLVNATDFCFAGTIRVMPATAH